MLTTNLSTRPFYNERAVRTAISVVLVLVVLLTALSVFRALSLRAEEQALSARATQALSEAGRLRAEADRMMAQIDPKDLAAVSAAAAEANDVIAQRAFSWNALLADLEETLPANVRVTAVQPRVEKGVIKLTLDVEAMSPEELSAFMKALDARGSFQQVLPRNQSMFEDVISASIDTTYQPRRVSAGASSDASRGASHEAGPAPASRKEAIGE
jgi:Tfp pilus assembly protein PilN